jgi:3-dehydroquinate synthase
VTHGEAVALGMVAAGRLAERRGTFPAADLQRMIALIAAVGLPTSRANLDPAEIFAAMATDKKVQSGKLRLILPTRIGAAEIVSDVPETEIIAAIRSLAS